MAYETSKANADCCVVALANYFGKPYDVVLEDLNAARQFAILEDHFKHGFFQSTWLAVMKKYEGCDVIPRKPRRGQEKLTGIARVARAGCKSGHLIAVIDGHVFDSWAKGMPIKEYMKQTRYHLKVIYF